MGADEATDEGDTMSTATATHHGSQWCASEQMIRSLVAEMWAERSASGGFRPAMREVRDQLKAFGIPAWLPRITRIVAAMEQGGELPLLPLTNAAKGGSAVAHRSPPPAAVWARAAALRAESTPAVEPAGVVSESERARRDYWAAERRLKAWAAQRSLQPWD